VTSDDWPIVERWELLEAIRANPQGCVLVGPGGIGKSTAARLAAHPAPTVAVAGVEGLSAIPFGALHLAEMATPDAVAAGDGTNDDAVVHLQRWLEALAANATRVIIDDPAHLDRESIALLADHLARGGPVTITHRPDQPIPDPLSVAIDDAAMPTIEIDPLDESMVALAIELASGVEPTPAAAAHLAALSGGNPMLLRELVRDLTTRAMWIIDEEGASIAPDADPSPRLNVLLRARLPQDDAAVACLELIAHAGSITRLLADRASGPATVDGLVDAGWVVGDEVLAIAHPLMRQFVTGELDPVRIRRQLAGALDAIGDPGELDATSRLQCLRWALALDRAVSIDELRWGRQEAPRRFDTELACSIAERLSRSEPTVDATLELALVLAQAERYDEVVDVLRAGQHLATSPAEIIDIARFLLRFTGPLARLRGLGDPPEGLEVDVAGWADDRLGTTAFAGLLAALERVAAGALDEACDRADEARANGLPGFGDPDEIAMVSALYLGDDRRALDAFDRLDVHLRDPRYRHPKAVIIDAAASSLLMLAGRFEDAFEFDGDVADAARATNDHERAREMTGHRGMTALFTGRVDAAIESFTRFRGYPAAPGSLRTLYTAGLAQSYALAGRLGDARRVLTEAERDADLVTPLMLPDYENMVAMTLVLLGHVDAGEQRMRTALELAITSRGGRSELMAWHGLARMDRIRPPDMDRIGDLPSHVTMGAAGFTTGVLAMVHGRNRGDAALLADAADTFAATEFGIGAAEAYAAAACAVDDVRRPDARRWLGELDTWLQRRPGLVGATVLVDRGVERLTERERQIAGLAAGGLANPEIAERLGRSVRTIENNLHRTFVKLGIATRAELRPALLPAVDVVAG
jgi:DNA-binding CsgD family transcriptional regulator